MSVVAMMLHPDRVEAVELATQIASYLNDSGHAVRLLEKEAAVIDLNSKALKKNLRRVPIWP
jgi:hypothetical protein